MNGCHQKHSLKKENRNWFGYQIGLKFSNIFFKKIHLLSEYKWTEIIEFIDIDMKLMIFTIIIILLVFGEALILSKFI